jgi:hypothetical protein
MKPSRMFLVASVAVVLWIGYRAYRAHANLVTLNVHNMEVRRVVSKLEWQTWECIVVNKAVGGNVTLNVHNVPLEEVLNIVGLQTDSRWTRLYPVYSTGKSLNAFKQVLQGNLPPVGNGWSALQQLAAWQQFGLGGFANTLRADNKLVSAEFVSKDAPFAALALSRFSKAQVVPEDDTKGVVNLKLEQVSFEKAVSKVARQVKRKWAQVYTLQPLNAQVVVRKTAPGAPDTNATPELDTNQVVTTPYQAALPPERALEALVSTMTPEERQQTLDQISGANQNGASSPGGGQQQMQAGSPAAQAAQVAAQQDIETRIDNRLKNGTIDQRLAHDRRVLNSKQPEAKP